MTEERALSAALLLAVLAGSTARCAMYAGPSVPTTGAAVHYVAVDKKVVPAVGGSLLDLLRQRLPANRLNLLSPGYANGQPLIVVDGVRLHGGSARLSEIAALDVKRVTTFHALDAHVLYGPDGYSGAIVVETLTGR